MIRSKNGYGVDRVDTATLKATPVEAPHPGIDSYWSDGQGNVRLMSEAGIANNLLTGKTKYYYRAAGSRDWKTLIDFDDDDDFVPLAVDATSDSLYVLKPLNGRKALYRIKLDGSLSSELIASHPKVDIDNVIRSANGQRVIGYTYATDKRAGEYFDPEYKALVSSLATPCRTCRSSTLRMPARMGAKSLSSRVPITTLVAISSSIKRPRTSPKSCSSGRSWRIKN